MNNLFNGRVVSNIVVGAGINGLCTAYYLASAGEEVLVVDRKPVGLEASGVNAGNLGIQNKELQFTKVCMSTMALWRKLSSALEDDIEYREIGGIAVAETSEQAEKLESKVEAQRRMGLDVELMSGSEARKEAPYLSSTVVAAAYCAGDAHANPPLTMSALRRLSEKHGAEVVSGAIVTGLRQNDDGGFVLDTSVGGIRARTVVLATGAWIAELAAQLGVNLPIWVKPLQGMVTERVKPIVPHLITHIGGKLSIKQMQAGSVVIGGGWSGISDLQTNEKRPQLDNLLGNLQKACRVVPGLRKVNLLRCWAGHDARMSDELPLLGEALGVRGLFLVGCSPAGFGFGPLFGKTTAELVKGSPLPDWAVPFSVQRAPTGKSRPQSGGNRVNQIQEGK